MSWMIVVEETPLLTKEIEEALLQIEPQMKIAHFDDSKQLMRWLELVSKRDVVALSHVPQSQFRGIISAVETWNFKDIRLIEKFSRLFYQMGFATKDQELCVVLTGYDTPHLHKKRFEARSVNNFIFKPFDKLLLKQMLEIAITGRHPCKKYYIHNLKTDVQVEMLKEIRMSEVTEIGFQTISDQNVETGKLAKYYAPLLETRQHKSALARAVSSEPIPGTHKHRVNLGFFALDQQQSFNLQKTIQGHKKTRPMPSSQDSPGSFEFIFLQSEQGGLCQQVRPSIERFFDHTVTVVKSTVELGIYFKKARETQSGGNKLLFIDSFFILGNELSELQNIAKMADSLELVTYVLSPRVFSENLEVELSRVCEDVFYAPFNRSYIVKTLWRKWPQLRNREEMFESHAESDQMIHVSNPVKLVEVSEVGLVFEYYRDLPIGEFREFILWLPDEANVPIILGQCNSTEYLAPQKVYHCQYIFFSLQDIHLKHIRRWMLHNHIETKNQQAS